MGRVDTDAPQHHQTPQETIDDAPPLNEDLYGPPSHYQPQPAAATNNQPPPPPQAFPPPHDHHPATAIHAFPPPQDYNKPPPPPAQPFPPPQDYPDKPLPQVGQLFNHQEQTPQPVSTPNQYIPHQVHHQQPPNVVAVPQFPAYQNVQQQPVAGGIPVGFSPSPFNTQQTQLPTGPWKTSLFDCMRNPQNAIITLFFPCVTFGQIAEILDSGSTSCGTSGLLYSVIAFCIAMPCIMSCSYRTKLRSKFGLVESPAPDWVIHCFCEYCALCQEYRELEERGIDPAVGWMGNAAKQQQQMPQQFGMTPPMPQRMM